MRKIGFAKFKNSTKEILPKTYKIQSITCQRQMFCTMINQYLSKKSQFNLKNTNMYEYDLLSIFEDKILSFFQFYKLRPEKTQKITKLYIDESLVFNQYFKQSKNLKMRYLTKSSYFNPKFKLMLEYEHPAIDLIQLIFNGKEVEMMLDLNEIFARTVFNRIKKEKDKKVTYDSPYIHIDQHGIKTRLYPKWKHVDTENIKQREADINDAFKELNNDEINQYYLVYPKRDKFKQHMIIKDGNSKKELKMIPYSFTFCNKKEKKRCKK